MSQGEAYRVKTDLRLLAKYFKEAELARQLFDRVKPPLLPGVRIPKQRRIDITAHLAKLKQYERAYLEKSMLHESSYSPSTTS